MISVTITDRSGRTLSGQTIEAFWDSVAHAQAVRRRHQLRARRATTCARTSPSCRAIADCCVSAAIRTPGCPTRSASTTSSRSRPRRSLRDFAASGFVNIVGGCCGTTPDHIAAIARRRRGRRAAACGRADLPRADPVQRPRGADDPARRQLPDDRRAHQRHRLDEVRPPDHRRRLQRGGRRRPRAGARRRQHPRRQHGRGHARLRARHDHVPQPDRHRAGSGADPGHGRQLEVVGHRGRPEVPAGQGRRQLDQPEGRRGGLPAPRRRRSRATAPAWW